MTERLLAWTVHLVTASGSVFGLLSLIAITQHEWMFAFICMAAAIFVDSVDGTLARMWRVKQIIPNFDGALLDNIIDYLNYVVVPAFFLYEAALLPPELALAGAALVVLTSGYQFCQADAKTDDNHFKGFPSYWNVVVFYLFLLGLNPWISLGIIALLGFLVFVPIHYVYPSRTVEQQRLTLVLSAVWGATTLIALLQYPNPQKPLIWASLLYVLYYVGLSLYQTANHLRHRESRG
ncbi:MAG: CDP-alcohol phosphatidyltransferase family protein [Ardenticatenales bacterium]|nr:CDP-alcohol phosphatidyltransferase family protein [Ardenticatenales bacterium]